MGALPLRPLDNHEWPHVSLNTGTDPPRSSPIASLGMFVTIFFQNPFLQYQTVLVQSWQLGLIWVQTVCKGYQQKPKVTARKEGVRERTLGGTSHDLLDYTATSLTIQCTKERNELQMFTYEMTSFGA